MAEIIHLDARKFCFVLFFCDNEKAILVYKVSSRITKAVTKTSPASKILLLYWKSCQLPRASEAMDTGEEHTTISLNQNKFLPCFKYLLL